MEDIDALLEQYGVGANWLRCVDCRWVFRTDRPNDFGAVCPRCAAHALMAPFPRVEAWHLIEIVLGHAARLDPDSAKQEHDLLGRLDAAGLSGLRPSDLRELAAQARLRVERGGYDALAEVGAELSERGASPEQALGLALELLVVAGQASPDVEAVLVLAATALEALLDELWIEALGALGLDGRAVAPLAGLTRRTSVPRQRILLAELTEPLGRYPFEKDFVARWDEILEHRNAVVHGRPFLVSYTCAQQAVGLAAESVAAFAEANNRLLQAADLAAEERSKADRSRATAPEPAPGPGSEG